MFFSPRSSLLALFIVSDFLLFSHGLDHTCSINDRVCLDKDADSSLKPMTYDLDYGEELFMAYTVPDVSTFYKEPPGKRKVTKPKFNGLAGKFFNLSPDRMKLYWDPGHGGTPALISDAEPFRAVGTATFPGHKFYFVLARKSSGAQEVRHRFHVHGETNLFVYDPFISDDSDRKVEDLSPEDYEKYISQRRTLKFSQYYREFTGRDWISRFPRKPPTHFMWPADYIGQQHVVETKETYFNKIPDKGDRKRVSKYGMSDEEREKFQKYRVPEPTLNLNITVMSIAPRVFEIKNFLSDTEIDHILKLSTGLDMGSSTVSGGGEEGRGSSSTRTSTNSWVYRETTIITETIYRRAADVLRIDEALLRSRNKDEYPNYPSPGRRHSTTIAEALQLVHYDVNQEYTAHHDFGYPPVTDPEQSARFCTLLLYLNEGMKGGETAFPRWVNAETREALKASPEKGKAVLFYSFLPDGNMDDLSQHAAQPVIEGEKWLMNLWVWDTMYH